MNRLTKALVEYIEEYISSCINASEGGDARFEFVGVPKEILQDILSHFKPLRGINVLVKGQDKNVPVYLLEDVSNNPDNATCGICNDAYLTMIRNCCPYFLALIPPHKLENKSIKSSIDTIGVTQIPDGQKWREHHLINDLIEKALSLNGCSLKLFKKYINHTFDNASVLDEHANDYAYQWEILNVFFNINGCENNDGKFDDMTAACGFPRLVSKPESSFEYASKVLNNIVEGMKSEGLINFFERISGVHLEEIFVDNRDLIEPIRGALEEFKNHLFSINITNAPQFESAPCYYYSPYRNKCENELPSWWKLLTIDIWRALLEDENAEPEEEFKIFPNNTIVKIRKSHPYIVKDKPNFVVEEPSSNSLPKTINVERGVGRRNMLLLGSLSPEIDFPWEDNSPPDHEKYLRYKFSDVEGKFRDNTIQVISLEKFIPGIIIDSRTAKKITLLKKKKNIWECDVTLLGKEMQHHFDVYFNSKTKLDNYVKYFTINGKELFEELFSSSRDGKNQIVLDFEEEGFIEIIARNEALDDDLVIHVNIHLEDIEASGVGSWYEKLIELHCNKKSDFSSSRIDISWNKSQQLSKWILDDKKSYYPLVMGYDYRENWINPDWDSMPILSKNGFSNDIRPRKDSFIPPDSLLECRESVRNLVNKEDGALELANLGEIVENKDNLEKIISYIKEYSKWLKEDPENALWFDTVSIIRLEASGSVFSQQPDALLLNPLHPIRIGWQFLAQDILYSSLLNQKHCPAASILNPCSTPDFMMLPCWTAGQQVNPVYFISLNNSSDYWAVLWNGNEIDHLTDKSVGMFFDDDFGIKVDGIAAGFTTSQVTRALNDISMIRSGRSCLKISLIDDTVGSSSCTDGIIEWASNQLGEEDQWLAAGQKSLEVYDSRNKLQRPSNRQIANLTNDTLGSVRWFEGRKIDGDTTDLTIINHLGSMNSGLANDKIYSAVGFGTLVRKRIRRQLPTETGNHFISESRKAHSPSKDGKTLSEVLECLSFQLEEKCDGADSYIFAPKMIRIQENLKESGYCAASSSIIDPSCFFDAGQNAYIWDYDMPTYSSRAGSNNGYYLIASESDPILQAVKNNLREFAPNETEVDQRMIRSILKEISGRGVPTLKRLVTQGATSTGEIGLLVALRILQNINDSTMSLMPIIKDKNVNLVIPIDPFTNMITDLKRNLGMSASRPDLLIASIDYQQGTSIKLTPIEVKHRSGGLMENDKKEALKQASEFSDFLIKLQTLSDVEPIWKIAMVNLISTMVDFSFRATGVTLGMGRSKEWAEIHSRVLQAIMSGDVKQEIDDKGRLIIINNSPSKPLDLDQDSFNETLTIEPTDAFKIIVSNESELMGKIKGVLNDWKLRPSSVDNIGLELEKAKKKESINNKISITSNLSLVLKKEQETHPFTTNEVEDHPKEHVDVTNDETNFNGIRFPVGRDITSPFKDSENYFYPSNTLLNQLNIGIVGDLGTGKTQLVKSLIYRFIKSRKENRGECPKFLIFDYKEDYLNNEFINATNGRVVKPFKIPLNLFDISGKEMMANPLMDTISFFSDIISKIYNVDKPNQHYLLKEAIKECFNSFNIGNGNYPTIYDVFSTYKKKNDGKVDSTLSILSDIVDRELFEEDTKKIKSFKDFFEGVTIIDLKSLGQNDNTKNMIVVIFLHLFYDYMLKIEKKPFIGSEPQLRFIDSMLLVDEANSIMKYNFDVLQSILLQGREFGVGVLLASQYLSHFKQKKIDYTQPLLTWFIHKVPNITKNELQSIGLENINTDLIARIKSLGLHECLYKSFGTSKEGTFIKGYPFYELLNKDIDI